MELQHIIWSWETVTGRIIENDPAIGRPLWRSCRPIAAQRYRDGRLLVVLGCWWREDLELLRKEPFRSMTNDSLGKMLAERIVASVVRWPGGLASSWTAVTDDEQVPVPDILVGLSEPAREEASKCESAIQRLFFATACRKGLELRCQVPVLNYRLDFAVPERRVGAEVLGWDWRSWPAGGAERREREQRLEQNGWQILLFSGSQVLSDVDKCVDELTRAWQMRRSKGGQPTPQTLPSAYPPERRKPFSSLGKMHGREEHPGTKR